MQEELVSVILPTYNRRYIIGDAIDSCLSQSYKNLEIIVCDDHSTDGTKEYIATRMKEDERIRYCVTPKGKKGANAARNAGIKTARGKYIAFLDSDDYLTQDSISDRMQVFAKNNVVMVYGNAICELRNRRIKWIYTDIRKENLNQKKYLMQELSLCQQNMILVKSAVFQKIGLLDEKQKGWTDDGLVVAVGMRYPVMHCGKFVAVVRKSEVSMTSDKWNMYYGCRILVDRYKSQIISHASFGRYLLWKVRLLSLYCFARERDAKPGSVERKFWELSHHVTRKIFFPYFRGHCE